VSSVTEAAPGGGSNAAALADPAGKATLAEPLGVALATGGAEIAGVVETDPAGAGPAR
jgi:hypothetical protein